MSKQKAMLIKFESKSNRVKGLSFHPRRPWILASLHNGCIQLWDYRMEVLIEKYEEHDGPVRGIHFHTTQPLFVSGGDDYKIKVWNYTLKRCLFNLIGHLDYIRTVEFHHEYPWILSASDDQTIRIWNWQSRQCINVLTGHTHYVMCASFHPKEDLVLSASLDQTVRVWDFSGLRKKTVSIAGDYPQMPSVGGPGGMQQANGDVFGVSDVIVRHVLEGHTRGVNWASFHRSLNLIVSGDDDREVKLWRYNESKAWDLDTMRGHLGNVSSVLFHPKRELIISNSEDKTIRVWDISKVATPLVLRREHDRYWILDAHPTLNLLAAGHDSGLMVFKLFRERPPYDAHNSRSMYYFKDQYVYEYSYKTGKEKPILSTRRRGSSNNNNAAGTAAQPNTNYKNLHYNTSNQAQHCILLTSDVDGSYELYTFPKSKEDQAPAPRSTRGAQTQSMDADVNSDSQSALRGYGKCAVFVGRNRFAVLDKQRTLTLRTLKNEVKRKITVPNVSINYIFPGGAGRLILRTSELMILYDIQTLKVIGELPTQSRNPIKYISWNEDNSYLAMYSKATIYVTNNRFEEVCTINENSRIKSGAWDPIGVFVYTTATHIKYLLPNGENGILRTLETPIYITSASSTSVTYLDREFRTGKLTIDATEYLFKIALLKHKNREVLKIMQSKKLVGESIIAYLHKKGYPEVALHFVEDPTIKFSLALECGNIGVALECAQKLDKDECWHKLGVEALRQGNHQVVEAAYQRTKNFERLSFLYLLTGNIDKLSKMLHIATLRNDMQGRFHNALYLGNIPERINILRESGQLNLAYITAKTHGLEDEAEAILTELGGPEKVAPTMDQLIAQAQDEGKLLLPPTPILRENNWPLLEVRKGFFDQMEAPDEVKTTEGPQEPQYESSGDEAETGGEVDLGWGADGDADKKKAKGKTKETAATASPAAASIAGASSAWGGDLDIDIPGADAEPDDPVQSSSGAGDYFVMPSAGKSATLKWSNNSTLAADQIAAGEFEQAMHLLSRQIGVYNFAPLKEGFLSIHNAAHAYLPLLPLVQPHQTPLFRLGENGRESDFPCLSFKLTQVVEPLKSAYKNVTQFQIAAALSEFVSVLHTLPLIVVDKRAEISEVNELIGICREYITAMRLELKRQSDQDPVRQCAYATYFTQCKLQTTHLLLGLKMALKPAHSVKNYAQAAGLCRRILEICASTNSPALLELINLKQIKGVLQLCEKENKDYNPIDCPDTNFTLCCSTLTPIAKGKPISKCPYCGSHYHQEYEGQICQTCGLAKIGVQATGLKVFAE